MKFCVSIVFGVSVAFCVFHVFVEFPVIWVSTGLQSVFGVFCVLLVFVEYFVIWVSTVFSVFQCCVYGVLSVHSVWYGYGLHCVSCVCGILCDLGFLCWLCVWYFMIFL